LASVEPLALFGASTERKTVCALGQKGFSYQKGNSQNKNIIIKSNISISCLWVVKQPKTRPHSTPISSLIPYYSVKIILMYLYGNPTIIFSYMGKKSEIFRAKKQNLSIKNGRHCFYATKNIKKF
jgi:hypothetical protein